MNISMLLWTVRKTNTTITYLSISSLCKNKYHAWDWDAQMDAFCKW